MARVHMADASAAQSERSGHTQDFVSIWEV